MTFSICFIERRDTVSPSIERVFRSVAGHLEALGVQTEFVCVPFGNGILGIILNLLLFRPPAADLLHITGHVNYLGLVLPRSRTISTVHDLTILGLRSGLRRWLIEKLFFVWPARRLRYLTAISEATMARLMRTAAIGPEKVRVIHNPLLVSRTGKKKFNTSNTRILQIGTAPNKNVERLVTAISGLSCELHIVGRVSNELRQHISENKVPFVNDEGLDDAGIEAAYERADILALCSTDEGFGLPIIEAQAKQTPVITSDRLPMSDLAGGGAVLADPESVESIREGILRIVADPQLRDDLAAKGLTNITRFDAAKIADDYLSLYRSVLAELGK